MFFWVFLCIIEVPGGNDKWCRKTLKLWVSHFSYIRMTYFWGRVIWRTWCKVGHPTLQLIDLISRVLWTKAPIWYKNTLLVEPAAKVLMFVLFQQMAELTVLPQMVQHHTARAMVKVTKYLIPTGSSLWVLFCLSIVYAVCPLYLCADLYHCQTPTQQIWAELALFSVKQLGSSIVTLSLRNNFQNDILSWFQIQYFWGRGEPA